MVRRIFLATALGVALLVACKPEDKHPPLATESEHPSVGSAGGGGSSSGSALDAGATDGGNTTDAGQCSDLALTGSESIVDENGTQEAAPAGTGGTIQNGTYDLTQASRFVGAAGFPGPTGTTFRGVIRITNGTTYDHVQIQGSSSSTAVIELHQRATLQTASTQATLSFTCPSANVESLSYTATDSQLTLTDLETGNSLTYTIRP